MSKSAAVQTRTVTMKQLKNALRYCVKAKQPVMIWGPPGIGKSDCIAQICANMGGMLWDMRLSQCEQTDLRGMPFYNKETNTMDWAPPIDLPSEKEAAKYPITFLFLDEMNSAAPAVQAAGYQLVLNRRVGTYKLPDNCVVVAAGNREQDKGVTYRQPAPLSNRFVHFELQVDFDSWNEWAVGARIHKDVVGYLNFSKNSLYDFDPTSSSKAFATPRSWEFVSKLIDDDCDELTATDIIAGTIGEGLAVKFLAHRRLASKMPAPRDILEGKVSKLDTDEISVMYSLMTSMTYELQDEHARGDDDRYHMFYDNMIAFAMDNFQKEIVIMGLRTAIRQFKLPFSHKKLKNFDRFHKEYHKLIHANIN